MSTHPSGKQETFAVYRRALQFAKPYWGRFFWVFLLGILASSLGLLQPYFSKLLIDDALMKGDFRALVAISGAMIGATVLGFVLNILSSYAYVKASSSVLFDMRLSLYRHLHQLSPRFWSSMKMGDVVSRINNDISEIQRITSDSLMGILTNVIFFIGSAGIMASMNRKLMLLSLIAIPLSLWSTQYFQGRLQSRVRLMRERSSEIGSFLLETLLGVRTVASSRALDRESGRFRDKNSLFVEALMSMQVVSFLASAIPGTLVAAVSGGLFLYGGMMVIRGEITTGSLVAIMAYHARLLSPVQNLMGLYTSMITGAVSLDRVYELLDTKPEITDRPGAVAMENPRGEIVCENLTFRHGDHSLFNGLSLRVPAGKICAVLGPSGIGKSTLGELMARYYDPEGGAVFLDGHDLRDLTLASVRKSIMLVEQNPYLFQATVRENIAYACPDATQAEIEAAAKSAAIHDRIVRLQQSYNTVLAERGQTLSAGERQRIALARALLANPAVLILDEPTSSLDEANEAAIADTLASALKGRTAILITHRAGLARIADQTNSTMRVEVRGDGIAAFCCVHLLRQAGIETSLTRLDRPRVPALLLSFPALQLIREIFESPTLLAGCEPIRKRVVQWDSRQPLLEMEHLGFVTSEQELLEGLLPDVPASSQGDPDWVVHCANQLPEGVTHERFGSRKASAWKVALRDGDACVMESLASGWLFLLPVDPQSGWMLSVGDGGLESSRVVSGRVREAVQQPGEFAAYPRIASRLTGGNWLACGSAAMAFDPICGDGTALAVRAAILAAAVIRAVARGEDRELLLQHYEARVRAGFGRHVELCQQYYRNGFGGEWWDRELAALGAWPLLDARSQRFDYRLNGFDLERIR